MSDLPLIIGTAGHVDHGKTTLIRALTGVDTDRLAEEKRRGMTIDLGFAPFVLPGGRQAGVVDVPGHERFLKNMLAGAGGMDVVMLVVAADDGVMPQTREHLDILATLRVPRGLVVLTKIDAVDPELVELAIEDVCEALAGTFMAGAPIIPVSAQTGEGLDALRAALVGVADAAVPRDASSASRLPIDRVFVKQGFGTVVTGTLVAGTIREGDAVAIEPAGLSSRVRGLHVHGEKRAEARAGQRVAVNLVGLEKHEIGRGDWLVAANAVSPSTLLDVRIELLPQAKPLAHRTRIRLHHGTGELIGRVVLLDREVVEPGGTALAQLVLERPAAAVFGDRFVLRRYAPAEVVGGGEVLHAAPAKHRRGQAGTLASLERLGEGDPLGAMAEALRRAGEKPLDEGTLLGFVPPARRDEAKAWLKQHAFEAGPGRWLHGEGTQAVAAAISDSLAKFHQAMAWRAGLSVDDLAKRTKLPQSVVAKVAAASVASGALTQVGRLLALPTHVLTLPPELARARQAILDRYREAPLADQDDFASAGAGDKLAALLEDLVEAGTLVRVSGGIYASAERLVAIKARLREAFAASPQLTASQMREAIETSRKYAIPFLEYLDSSGFTRRQGDVRTLIERVPA